VPALNALDRRFPEARITLIGLPWTRELAERLPAVDTFLEFPGYPGLPELPVDEQRTAAFIDGMRHDGYDIAIQLHGSGPFTNELVSSFGADISIGYGPPGDPWLSQTLPWLEDENEIERWLRLVAFLGANTADSDIDLPIREADRLRANHLLGVTEFRTGPLIGLHCGSKLESRRWPIERFAELGDDLARRYGARIVLTGNQEERDLAASVQERMHESTLNLAGKTDLGSFFALIEKLALLVTNDTGASHVAAATHTRSVVLFGPSRPSRWAPLDRALHTVIDTRAVIGRADFADDDYLHHLPLPPVLQACEQALVQIGFHATADSRRRAYVTTERV
jgi:ADP-heptose:LPS heptosyltransferase